MAKVKVKVPVVDPHTKRTSYVEKTVAEIEWNKYKNMDDSDRPGHWKGVRDQDHEDEVVSALKVNSELATLKTRVKGLEFENKEQLDKIDSLKAEIEEIRKERDSLQAEIEEISDSLPEESKPGRGRPKKQNIEA